VVNLFDAPGRVLLSRVSHHNGCGFGGFQAQEPHQPFEILDSGGQVELLAHELHPAQTQAAQSDLVLEFGKQRLHFSTSPLRRDEGRCSRQLLCSLPRRFVDVDCEKTTTALRALRLL
jgi:hypothetical protein